MVTGTRGKVTLVESHPPSKIAMLTVTCQLSPPKKGTPMFIVIKYYSMKKDITIFYSVLLLIKLANLLRISFDFFCAIITFEYE